jgi:signal transduction histidine kinase
MVEELLFLSRVDVGGLELELDDVDVVELARTALGSADPAAASKRISLEYDGPDTLHAPRGRQPPRPGLRQPGLERDQVHPGARAG